MAPSESLAGAPEDPEPPGGKRVRVPVRHGDGVFTADEHALVDAEAAAHWDTRLWHDRPPR